MALPLCKRTQFEQFPSNMVVNLTAKFLFAVVLCLLISDGRGHVFAARNCSYSYHSNCDTTGISVCTACLNSTSPRSPVLINGTNYIDVWRSQELAVEGLSWMGFGGGSPRAIFLGPLSWATINLNKFKK
ncbi:hypothetical protein OROMI_016826 [Orobanche minor]